MTKKSYTVLHWGKISLTFNCFLLYIKKEHLIRWTVREGIKKTTKAEECRLRIALCEVDKAQY